MRIAIRPRTDPRKLPSGSFYDPKAAFYRKKEQINKIASALYVSPLAFGEFDSNKLRMETVGDLMGLLIMLYKSGVIAITGRKEKEFGVKPEGASIVIAGPFEDLFSVESSKGSLSINKIDIRMLDQQMLSDFVKWANLYSNHKSLEIKYENTESVAQREYMQGNEDQMALLELELMALTNPLKAL